MRTMLGIWEGYAGASVAAVHTCCTTDDYNRLLVQLGKELLALAEGWQLLPCRLHLCVLGIITQCLLLPLQLHAFLPLLLCAGLPLSRSPSVGRAGMAWRHCITSSSLSFWGCLGEGLPGGGRGPDGWEGRVGG